MSDGHVVGQVTDVTEFTVQVEAGLLLFRVYKLGYSAKWTVGDTVKVSQRDIINGSYMLEAQKEEGFHVRAFTIMKEEM